MNKPLFHATRLILFAAIFWSASGLAQMLPTQGKKLAIPEVDVSALLDRLGGLPPEYKADIGFAVLKADWNNLSPARKKRVLDQIFQSSKDARYPTALIYAARSPNSAASQAVHNLTVEPLDALNIQSKVIDISIGEMPAFAADEFAQVSPKFQRSACSDPTVADLSPYYDIALKVLKSPDVKSIGALTKAESIYNLAAGATSLQQMAPLLKLIAVVDLTDSERQQVVAVLTKNIGDTVASDREMSALYPGMSYGFRSVIFRLRKDGISVEPLLVAYRAFLVRNLASESCSDNTLDRASIAKSFQEISQQQSMSNSLSLNNADLLPKLKGASALDPSILMDPSVMQPLQRLSAINRARVAAAAQGDSSSDIHVDSSDVDIVLEHALSARNSTGICPLCDYESRAFEFFMLSNSLPSGQYLQRALSSEVDFLSFNPMEERDPTAFLLVLKQLINISRPVSIHTKEDLQKVMKVTRSFEGAPSDAPDALRNELKSSDDRIIKTYMSFEQIFHPYYKLPDSIEQRIGKASD